MHLPIGGYFAELNQDQIAADNSTGDRQMALRVGES